MSLTKHSSVDKVEIVNADTIPVIYVRTATWIEENGEVVGGKSYHRHVITPDADLSGESDQVHAMASALFTTQVKADYAAMIAAQQLESDA